VEDMSQIPLTEAPKAVTPAEVHESWLDKGRRAGVTIGLFALATVNAVNAGLMEVHSFTSSNTSLEAIKATLERFAIVIPPDIIAKIPHQVNLGHVGAVSALVAAAAFFSGGALRVIEREIENK